MAAATALRRHGHTGNHQGGAGLHRAHGFRSDRFLPALAQRLLSAVQAETGSNNKMTIHDDGKISRRQVLKTVAASAAGAGLGAWLPQPLYAATATPETTKAVLGFIALTDSDLIASFQPWHSACFQLFRPKLGATTR